MPNEYFKPVETPVSTRQEVHSLKTVNGSGLTYTLCDRTSTSSKLANYFTSFNLPHQASQMLSGGTLARVRPELFQLNVDNILISNIPKEYYNDIIDGRSVTFTVPQYSGASSASTLSAKTILSTTYTISSKKQENELLGTNVAFLFCDEINKPYTGTTQKQTYSKSAVTTWNPGPSYINRPAAVSYNELEPEDINSDSRPFSAVNKSVYVTEAFPTLTNQGYNYDMPIGFVALDKGWIVITNQSVINNFPWDLGQILYTNEANTGSTTTDIYFSSTTYSSAQFVDIRIDFKTSVVALVFPKEFFFTTNPSWDQEKNFQEQQNGTFGYDAVAISEIGLFNASEELIAIAKLDRPLEKQYNDLVTFTLDINV